jgi:hypothetical protein
MTTVGLNQGIRVLIETKRISEKIGTPRLCLSQAATKSCIDILMKHVRSRIALIDELIDDLARLGVTRGAPIAIRAVRSSGRR